MQSESAFRSDEPPVWDDEPAQTDALPVQAPVVQPVRATSVPAAATVLETTPLGDTWHALVSQLDAAQAITALVRELAMQSQLVAQDGGVWKLCVHRTSLNQPMPRERLLKALSAISDCQQLEVENGAVSDTPALRNKAHAEARQKHAESLVLNDPQVQHLQRTYGATIVPGSIRPL
jgi:DNA polymerase III subunit gamma/tau